MGMRTFPALGFDPAPGSPSALLARAREADRAARALAGAAAAAGRLDARWRGAAADAYRDHARELPGNLGRAAAAHGVVARELTAYADDLAARQLRAADLEERAAALRARAGGWDVVRDAALVGAGVAGPAAPAGGAGLAGPAGADQVAGRGAGSGAGLAGPPGADRVAGPGSAGSGAGWTPAGADRFAGRGSAGSGAGWTPAGADWVAGRGSAGSGAGWTPAGPGGGDAHAAAAARAVAAELEAVIAEACRLLRDHHVHAAGAAARIRAAADDPPYRKPGLVKRLRDRARDWIAAHAAVLTQIARGLRLASIVLGVASLVPGFQFLAPAAIVLGTAAVAVDAGIVWATGRGSWAGLAADATLTALPTGPVARMVRAAPGVARGLKAVNRAIPPAVRGRVFRAVRNLPEGITPDQLAAAAVRIRSTAGGLTGDVVVQGSRAGHSARAASDIDFGLRVAADEYDRLIEQFFGDATTEARTNAVARGRIFSRHAGLKELRAALETDLDRKVDLAVIKRGGMFDNEPWLRVP
jgi:hypothetical protein